MTERLVPEHDQIPPELCPALALTIRDPAWLDKLTPAETAVLLYAWEIWARPEQIVPSHDWSTCGFDGARGFGKTAGICAWINGEVEAGRETKIGLMAPIEARTEEVQIKGLIAAAPPWFVPERFSRDGSSGLRWPNGVEAIVFTSATSGGARGGNFSLSWFTEIVDYKANTRAEAFNNMATATRVGRARILWDSTSKGRNEVLEALRAANARDPRTNVIIGGTMFQNPHLSDTYLKREWNARSGVRREEESLGRHFSQAAGALWDQEWIDRGRVDAAPRATVRHVGIDPASSVSETADETGLCMGERGDDGHAYIREDKSGKHKPSRWGNLALDWIPQGGRCTIETNQGGDQSVEVLRSCAEGRGLRVYELGRHEDWPEAEPGVVYVRRQFSRDSKGTRAEGPSVEFEQGRAHIVGELPDLEREMTTYVPGERKSPNRLDAMVFVVSELRGLNSNDETKDTAGAAKAAARVSELLAQRVAKATPARRAEPIPGGWNRPRMGF